MNKIQQRHTIMTGLISFAAMAIFFLLMKLVGLEDVPYLRIFNLVIVVYMSARLAKTNYLENHDIEYSRAISSLFIANALAVALSVIAFALYVKLIDPRFLLDFGKTILIGGANLREACASLFLEGMAGSIIVSFAVMQYWKDMKHKRPEEMGYKDNRNF